MEPATKGGLQRTAENNDVSMRRLEEDKIKSNDFVLARVGTI